MTTKANADSSTAVDAGDLLCLIIDLNPLAWALCSQPQPTTTRDNQDDNGGLSLDKALDMLIVFVNAHLSLSHENGVSVFVSCGQHSQLLLSTCLFDETTMSQQSNARAGKDEGERIADSNMYQQFKFVDDELVIGIKSVLNKLDHKSDDFVGKSQSGLVGALSKALCHINRLNANTSLKPNLNKPRPRIAIMSVSEDSSSHYVSVMNCIFTAQKNAGRFGIPSVPIDVCKIFGRDAVFLQQACHLTQGNYFKLARPSGLLQYLLMAFLPGPAARKHFVQPTHDQVDLRAACFCHRKIVDIGYVCSVCLSSTLLLAAAGLLDITKFPMATLKRLGFGSKPSQNGAAGPPKAKKRKVTAAPSAAAKDANGTANVTGNSGTVTPADASAPSTPAAATTTKPL
ncbi:RNA polymerase II transcription factor B subunit 4 [Microbotryomycetes sp. JL201]|nr:RNA polymerase II transcription factor B subunit 4 [Microbotryomycetes sp. JL201]